MRFLLSGYYGFGNLGDEALLRIIVSELKSRYPHGTIDVLSAEPSLTAHELGVEATQRWEQGAIRRAIERADVVLSGGGGLLQNATSLKSLFYYAGIIRTASNAKKKTMIFAQSIGPLDFWGKQTVRECCKGLSAATVRDERSRGLLAPLVSVPVERTADPVFLYEPPEPPVTLEAEGLGPESDPLVVVCVRKTAHWNDGVTALAAAVDRLAETHGAHVAFVPFGGLADAEASTLVIRKCRSKPVLVPLEGLDAVAAAIARARLVIGVRLHALILAAPLRRALSRRALRSEGARAVRRRRLSAAGALDAGRASRPGGRRPFGRRRVDATRRAGRRTRRPSAKNARARAAQLPRCSRKRRSRGTAGAAARTLRVRCRMKPSARITARR